MVFLLTICAGFALLALGMAIGYHWGWEEAERATYEAVDRWADRHHHRP